MSPASNLSASLGLLLRLSFRVGLGFRLGPRLGFRFCLRFGKRLLPLGLRLGLSFSNGFRFGLSLRFRLAPPLSPALPFAFASAQRAPWLPRPGLWPAPRRPRARPAWRAPPRFGGSGPAARVFPRLALGSAGFRASGRRGGCGAGSSSIQTGRSGGDGGGAAASTGLSSPSLRRGRLGGAGASRCASPGSRSSACFGDAVGARLRLRLCLLGALLAARDLGDLALGDISTGMPSWASGNFLRAKAKSRRGEDRRMRARAETQTPGSDLSNFKATLRLRSRPTAGPAPSRAPRA